MAIQLQSCFSNQLQRTFNKKASEDIHTRWSTLKTSNCYQASNRHTSNSHIELTATFYAILLAGSCFASLSLSFISLSLFLGIFIILYFTFIYLGYFFILVFIFFTSSYYFAPFFFINTTTTTTRLPSFLLLKQ